ncbi:MAG TPA: peptidoglycan editing factor PgeF [Thermomicrobiales bacterium]|nr:peptidoglycan editing factor PgeF [Thermomicrobiales bacterium]
MTTTGAVAFQFHSFNTMPLRHGMSGRHASAALQGDVGHSPRADETVIETNRRAFLEELGIRLPDLVVARQTHSATVRAVTRVDRGRGLFPRFDGFPATDGLMTNEPSVAVAAIVADCVPLLLYDPRQHALAVVHAGWRGTVGLIAAAAVEKMSVTYGTDPSDIVAGIGPSIGPCCYIVGEEVIDAWSAASGKWGEKAARRDRSTRYLDLWTANRLILTEAGVSRGRIEDSAVCVRCEADRFFSYRAARHDGSPHGRMMFAAQLDRPGH